MSKHAIIIIKKDDEYLNYYDERWNCYLFPNCKIEENTNIKKYISDILEIEEMQINMSFIKEITHRKFSESAKKEKEYNHYFYKAEINNVKDKFREKEFTVKKTKYRWFNAKDFEEDERIQKVNSDIIDFVKKMDR